MAIDSALGRLGIKQGVCTSSTRPTNPFEGQVIYESDTNRTLVYDNAAWVVVADSQVLSIDATNSRVGIGTTSPNHKLSFGTPANGSRTLAMWENGTAFYGIGNDVNRLTLYASNSAGTSERMSINSDGTVSVSDAFQYPHFMFSAFYSTNPAIWTGPTTIVFNSTSFNSANCYNPTNGRYTAPVSGFYYFRSHFFKYTAYGNSTNTYWGIETSNGYQARTNHGASGQDGGQEVSLLCYLSAGDYAFVNITSALTMQSYHSSPFNSFSGYCVSA